MFVRSLNDSIRYFSDLSPNRHLCAYVMRQRRSVLPNRTIVTFFRVRTLNLSRFSRVESKTLVSAYSCECPSSSESRRAFIGQDPRYAYFPPPLPPPNFVRVSYFAHGYPWERRREMTNRESVSHRNLVKRVDESRGGGPRIGYVLLEG